MVTLRRPSVELVPTVMVAVIVDPVFDVIVRVMPPLEKVSVAPGSNPPPFTVNVYVVPRRSVVGLTDEIDGVAPTVKPLVSVPNRPSQLVTVTSRGPTAASGDTDTTAVSRVALLRVSEVTVTPAPKLTCPPTVMKSAAKPEPLVCT